jgi:hypothetical protein
MKTYSGLRPIYHVPLYSTVFRKLKFKPKIKIKAPIEVQHRLKEIESLPLNILISFFLLLHTCN